MAKKIQGEDGKTYVEKKPFYKRVWFWIVVVLLIFVGIGAVGSHSSNGSNSSSAKKPSFYKVGDSVKVGKVTYTLNSVELTDERNEFADDNPANVIKVVYHVKNNSDEDLPIGTDLEAYGPDNTKLKSYPINNTTLDSVAAGKEADVTTGFGTDKLGKIELHFSPLVSTQKAAKFKVNVQ